MQLSTSNRFQSFDLTEEEQKMATNVSPLFLAHLQNKIASYASATINAVHQKGEDPHETVLRQEVLRAQVEVLEELFSELSTSS